MKIFVTKFIHPFCNISFMKNIILFIIYILSKLIESIRIF